MRLIRQCIASKGAVGLLALLLTFSALPATALAQVETGQIAGTVSDPQGAVVPGATITVESATGATRTVTTTGDGTYNITNLNPGQYEVRVEGAGFGTRTTLDVQLEVTATGESVDVIAG